MTEKEIERILAIRELANKQPVSKEFRDVLVDTLVLLPEDVVGWAFDNITFVSSCKDYQAFCVSKEDLKGKGVIVLCESLKRKSTLYQFYVIAHEIAHHKLKHEESNLTEKKSDKLEQEANDLALKWVEPIFGVEGVRKLKDVLIK
jgi:hypothetical protein